MKVKFDHNKLIVDNFSTIFSKKKFYIDMKLDKVSLQNLNVNVKLTRRRFVTRKSIEYNEKIVQKVIKMK